MKLIRKALSQVLLEINVYSNNNNERGFDFYHDIRRPIESRMTRIYNTWLRNRL